MSIHLQRSHPVFQALLLGTICAIVSLVLIGGHYATSTSINREEQADRIDTLNQVLPQGRYDNDPLAETLSYPNNKLLAPATLMLARKEGEVTATALQMKVAGWGGPLELIVATTPDGEILGARVLNHHETPGLGDKIERGKSDWITRFSGHSLANTAEKQWAVKKDYGSFDQFTGATITPRSVVAGIHTALEIQAQWQTEAMQPETATNTATEGETP